MMNQKSNCFHLRAWGEQRDQFYLHLGHIDFWVKQDTDTTLLRFEVPILLNRLPPGRNLATKVYVVTINFIEYICLCYTLICKTAGWIPSGYRWPGLYHCFYRFIHKIFVFFHPPTKLSEGNAFNRICLSASQSLCPWEVPCDHYP